MEKISLDDIRLFVAVVQAGSLSQASALTGVPVSRLSRRLTELENALGTKLLNRGKKGVHLNDLGTRFFEQAQTMLQQAQNAIDSVQTQLATPHGVLRLSVAGDVYHALIAPVLPEYLQLYPQVQLNIQLNHQKISMIQEGFDIAIRAGTIDNEQVVAKSLRQLRFGLFAAPDYVQQYGAPQTPHDLYQHSLIAQNLALPWRLHQQGQSINIMPLARVVGNDFMLVEQLIRQGMGIGMLFDNRPKSDLLPILPDWRLPETTLSVLYYKNRGNIPIVRSFVAWLLDKVKLA